jgi:hypothetical protein
MITNQQGKRIFDIADALHVLAPTAQWRLEHDSTNHENLVWESTDIAKPSQEAIDAEVARQQAAWDSQEYARNRAPEYPSITDQLDALWKGGAEADAMKAKIVAIKSKYPKS